MENLILGQRRDIFIGNLISYMNQLDPANPLYEKCRKTFSWLVAEQKKENERRIAEIHWLARTKEELSINKN